MSKIKTKYVCQQCGYTAANWQGKCNSCGAWNSFVEEQNVEVKTKLVRTGQEKRLIAINDVQTANYPRLKTAVEEFDRVTGGGFVPGSVTLIGGDPGIGKSTISLQIAQALAVQKAPVLYVSGEESLEQLKMRGERLNALSENIFLFSETNVIEIENALKNIQPGLIIIDSIQTVYHPEVLSSPGSVGQVREAAAYLIKMAKNKNISLVLIGHVTKEGAIAGPKVLEHMVDTVLYFEGERSQNFRILRSIKNRYGSTNEIGIFDMQSDGLAEVKNPSEIFLNDNSLRIPGSMVVPALEGTRSFLVEVQALVAGSSLSMPRRTFTGVDPNRAAIIAAVLEKKCGLYLSTRDIFVNVAGGVRLDEPAADLALALAIASSFKEQSVDKRLAAAGEIGLGSEIRPVANIEKRLNEVAKLGFEACVIPAGNLKTTEGKFPGLELIAVKTLPEALAKVF